MGGERQAEVLTKQGAEELTLEDVDDSVQRLIQLLVVLPQTLPHTALVLLSVVVEFGPVLLEELQGSLSIYNIKKKKKKQQSHNCNSQTAKLSSCDETTSSLHAAGLSAASVLHVAWALFT